MKLDPLLLFVSSAASAAMLAPATPAQTLVRSINGPAAGAQYGKACITIPDQNGDGYKDVLIGAPGFSSGRGAIYCLSGAYIAFGTGTQTLWSLAPTANPDDQFGYALADVGDHTGDGISDFVVGQPGYDLSGSNDVGAIRLVDGVSHTAVSLLYGPTVGGALGTALAACGDTNGDGSTDLAASAPGPISGNGAVYLVNGGYLAGNGGVTYFEIDEVTSFHEFGTSLASADLDGDGVREILIGSPGVNGGEVSVFATTPALNYISQYPSVITGERLGSSVDAAHDYDGDGVIDIVVGAPNSPHGTGSEVGRAVVLSGARLVAQTPPYEIHYLYAGAYGSPFLFSFHFGAAVRASGDLNNDGVGDILVGAPDYYSSLAQPGKGYVTVYSGATGTQLCGYLIGATQNHLGGSFAGAIQDLDGDGFKEFVVAGPLSDSGGTDSGVVKCYRLFPITPATYCTGKLNSLGCTPAITFSGSPKASIPTGSFTITATNFISQKSGLLFYSHAPITIAFQGGFKCVASSPSVRTPPQNSGGSASGSDCTGTYSVNFNARIQSGVDPSLVAGAEIYAQYWSRDPQSASTTSLSNALHFLINP